MAYLSNGKKELYQYDSNIDLIIEDDCDEVHFSNLPYGSSTIVKVESGLCKIPDELIRIRGELYCYGFVGNSESGYTSWQKVIKINQRPRLTKIDNKTSVLGKAKVGTMILGEGA